jgi:hypothetical protein
MEIKDKNARKVIERLLTKLVDKNIISLKECDEILDI